MPRLELSQFQSGTPSRGGGRVDEPINQVAVDPGIDTGNLTGTPSDAVDDLVDRFRATRRSNPAGRALAAGFDSAEVEGKARLFGQVHGVVEHHHAAVPEQGTSVARIALAWQLAKPHVTSVIIGAKNREQLIDNLASVDVVLSADQVARLDAASALPPE